MSTKRIHAFDALRAIMMLLGLVLHSAITYNVTNHGEEWLLKDPQTTHLFSDFLVFIIHFFRMPIFFFVAGFFGAMLFYERSPRTMIKNRVLRIVFPFVIFLVLLYPIIILTFEYTNTSFSGQAFPLKLFSSIYDFIPSFTFHLWFLHYLIIITGLVVIISFLLSRLQLFKNKILLIFSIIIKKPVIRIFSTAILIFIIFQFAESAMINASVSLVPDIKTLAFFSLFYLLGWCLFRSKVYLATFMRGDWISTLLAVLLVTIEGLAIQKWTLVPNGNSTILMFCNSVIISLFLFGITGLFVRYASNHSAKMRYASNASYWVYLIHLPLTAIIPSFIFDFPISAFLKFMIVLISTTVVCFVSYECLVCNTFIGEFLNGRKYSKKKYL